MATIGMVGGGLWLADHQFSRYREAEDAIAYFDGPASKPFLGKGDPSVGHRLFNTNCSSCHGPAGRGQIGLAPNIGNRDFLALASDRFIKQTVNHGRPWTAMIARPDLSDEDLTHIIAYLRSVPTGPPLDVRVDHELVVKGDSRNGSTLFTIYCAPCHGAKGEGYSAGGPAPGIGLPGFLEAASDDYILKTLAIGRTGTPMKPFLGSKGLANLSEQDAADIISFLRSDTDAAIESATKAAAPVTGPADPMTGKDLFTTHCSPCHQPGGVGKPGRAPSIRNRDFLALASDDFIRSTVLAGRAGTPMIARPDLQGAALDHIIAYLRSVPVAVPAHYALNPDRVSTGSAASGRKLFALYCAACHGGNGEGYAAGGAGPGIGLPGFLSVASDDYMFQTIRRGRVGTPMRGFAGPSGLANLSEQEINDIIVYLRSNE